jgi:hypothetical protein
MGFKKHINIKVIINYKGLATFKYISNFILIYGRSHYKYLWNIFKKKNVPHRKTSFPMRPDLSDSPYVVEVNFQINTRT